MQGESNRAGLGKGRSSSVFQVFHFGTSRASPAELGEAVPRNPSFGWNSLRHLHNVDLDGERQESHQHRSAADRPCVTVAQLSGNPQYSGIGGAISTMFAPESASLSALSGLQSYPPL